MQAIRGRVRDLVEATWFTRGILGVIIANAVVLGVETSINGGPVDVWLGYVDTAMLWIFVVELCLRIFAHGRKFFTDPWSIFDLLVVTIALVPASIDSLAALRALRILRALRVVNAVPSMKRVVNGLVAAVPGMGSVGALLVLVLYVSAVIATKLFRDISPEHFGNLGTTLFSLFQVMTGEAWPDIADAVMNGDDGMPGAWIFFVLFILVVSFAVLNLFIAVIVSGMESLEEELVEHDKEDDASNAALMAEIQAVRAELVALRSERDGTADPVDLPAGGAR
ncbi:ion transporter [Myceligenerans xiligouense]|uniref:Voltage-gated sodium channel n=1 Tax=Myceligenerans xiligouense TaxID=253184 RepID=A0A3N4YVC7_9MICO|nr:ion transporter [Myceligenerans xiligouense]RPF23354.1 voltage-gated sodium channel [Myceligenerans xiligouense]